MYLCDCTFFSSPPEKGLILGGWESDNIGLAAYSTESDKRKWKRNRGTNPRSIVLRGRAEYTARVVAWHSLQYILYEDEEYIFSDWDESQKIWEEETGWQTNEEIYRIWARERKKDRYTSMECATEIIETSVADPGSLFRILIFIHPGSQIQQQQKKRSGGKFVVLIPDPDPL